jgi:hypothetical protein
MAPANIEKDLLEGECAANIVWECAWSLGLVAPRYDPGRCAWIDRFDCDCHTRKRAIFAPFLREHRDVRALYYWRLVGEGYNELHSYRDYLAVFHWYSLSRLLRVKRPLNDVERWLTTAIALLHKGLPARAVWGLRSYLPYLIQ